MSFPKSLIVLAISSALTACGGGGGGDTSTSTTSVGDITVSGTAVAGPLNGAEVTLTDKNGNPITGVVAVQTNADGSYEIVIPSSVPQGTYILTVSADDSTTMTCDIIGGCGDGIAYGGNVDLSNTDFSIEAPIDGTINEPNLRTNVTTQTTEASKNFKAGVYTTPTEALVAKAASLGLTLDDLTKTDYVVYANEAAAKTALSALADTDPKKILMVEHNALMAKAISDGNSFVQAIDHSTDTANVIDYDLDDAASDLGVTFTAPAVPESAKFTKDESTGEIVAPEVPDDVDLKAALKVRAFVKQIDDLENNLQGIGDNFDEMVDAEIQPITDALDDSANQVLTGMSDALAAIGDFTGDVIDNKYDDYKYQLYSKVDSNTAGTEAEYATGTYAVNGFNVAYDSAAKTFKVNQTLNGIAHDITVTMSESVTTSESVCTDSNYDNCTTETFKASLSLEVNGKSSDDTVELVATEGALIINVDVKDTDKNSSNGDWAWNGEGTGNLTRAKLPVTITDDDGNSFTGTLDVSALGVKFVDTESYTSGAGTGEYTTAISSLSAKLSGAFNSSEGSSAEASVTISASGISGVENETWGNNNWTWDETYKADSVTVTMAMGTALSGTWGDTAEMIVTLNAKGLEIVDDYQDNNTTYLNNGGSAKVTMAYNGSSLSADLTVPSITKENENEPKTYTGSITNHNSVVLAFDIEEADDGDLATGKIKIGETVYANVVEEEDGTFTVTYTGAGFVDGEADTVIL